MEFFLKVFEEVFSQPPDVVLAYFMCMVAGVIVNWIWKCKHEKIDFVQYWTANPGSTILSILGAVAAFITTIIIEPGLGKQTYFAMGIACDSLLNKPPLPLSVQKALDSAKASFGNTEEPTETKKE